MSSNFLVNLFFCWHFSPLISLSLFKLFVYLFLINPTITNYFLATASRFLISQIPLKTLEYFKPLTRFFWEKIPILAY